MRLKVVPGARRDAVVGLLGDRLKVRVAAAPEAGRANVAVRRLLAETLGVAVGDVGLIAGTASSMKTVEVTGDVTRLDAVLRRLLASSGPRPGDGLKPS
ncbi:MAG: DUF167 domain-containing protein [Phycisphaeraceae bacterium]|nr:DUF167 domain-containing protein [Phycisphaeraceae bacterium]MCP4798007.1 DUF167 domain-containing protein [Phycisphaeraceae bacterium]